MDHAYEVNRHDFPRQAKIYFMIYSNATVWPEDPLIESTVKLMDVHGTLCNMMAAEVVLRVHFYYLVLKISVFKAQFLHVSTLS